MHNSDYKLTDSGTGACAHVISSVCTIVLSAEWVFKVQVNATMIDDGVTVKSTEVKFALKEQQGTG